MKDEKERGIGDRVLSPPGERRYLDPLPHCLRKTENGGTP